MNVQKMKARELADRGRCVEQADGTWLVFSLTSTNRYKVVLNGVNPVTGAGGFNTCTCPAWEITQDSCKHIRAVLSVQAQDRADREQGKPARDRTPEDEPIKWPRPTYKQDWESYDRAQQNEKAEVSALLGELCGNIIEPERKPSRGNQSAPLAAQAFAALFKVYCGMSGRRFVTDLRDAQEKGFTSEVVSHSTIARFFENEDNKELLKALVTQSAMPLRALETNFAVDSTGFSGCRFARWYDQKYGQMHKERVWVKAHCMTGVLTNCISAADVLDGDTGDAPQLPPLVQKTATGFKIHDVSADAAYPSVDNCDAVAAVGATGYFAFRTNTTGGVGGRFQEMYHRFCLEKENYLKHYHLRSNAESTFSGVKRLFGDSVRSKGVVAMKNEVLGKLVCYNLTCVVHEAYKLGIEPAICATEERPVAQMILKFPS
jgi:transposase